MEGEKPQNNKPDASTDAANALGGLVLTLPVVFVSGLIVGVIAVRKAGMEPIEIIVGINLLIPGVLMGVVATLIYPLGYLLMRWFKIPIGGSMFLGGLAALGVGWMAVLYLFYPF